MAKRAVSSIKAPKFREEVMLTPSEFGEEEYARLMQKRIDRQRRMEEALRCTHGRNRDRILLQERLDNTVELMGLINTIALAKASLTECRSLNSLCQLDSNMRELMHELRVLRSNEETVQYIVAQFEEAITVLMAQDLNLQKTIKDEVSKHCDSPTTQKICERMQTLMLGKTNLYDELNNRFAEKMERYLEE